MFHLGVLMSVLQCGRSKCWLQGFHIKYPTFRYLPAFEQTRLPGDQKVAVNDSVTEEKGPVGDIIFADSGRTCRRKKYNGSSYPQK
ncbi:uncharacterized protein EAE97_007027 [Botrytis byssoidea]|uniref:Uncharacterized protein n=1 Tax=Botrytis byssoidea TaxID=139641 RepID=A0A9P5M4P1_9HELO|nr:uncharacterized protein EAE97_007027 [Botrytis byssoidea]KAF7940841.1 hypothetical protein EAE97_007027 [Botrytis byssoidea]